jgi:hypothetical protein
METLIYHSSGSHIQNKVCFKGIIVMGQGAEQYRVASSHPVNCCLISDNALRHTEHYIMWLDLITKAWAASLTGKEEVAAIFTTMIQKQRKAWVSSWFPTGWLLRRSEPVQENVWSAGKVWFSWLHLMKCCLCSTCLSDNLMIDHLSSPRTDTTTCWGEWNPAGTYGTTMVSKPETTSSWRAYFKTKGRNFRIPRSGTELQWKW